MDRERIEALIARLERDDIRAEERDRVVESLQALTHRDIGADPEAWWEWLDEQASRDVSGDVSPTTNDHRDHVRDQEKPTRQTWEPVELRIERGLMVERARNARKSSPMTSTPQTPEKQYEMLLRQYGDSARVPEVAWRLDSKLFDWLEHVTNGAIEAQLETTHDDRAVFEIDGERLRIRDRDLTELLLDRIARASEKLEDRDFYQNGQELWCLTDEQRDWLREVAPFGLKRLEPRENPPELEPEPMTLSEIVRHDWRNDLRGLIKELVDIGRVLEFDAEYGYPVESYSSLNEDVSDLLDGAFDEVEWKYIHENHREPQLLRATCPNGTIIEREVENSDWVDVPPWLDMLNTILSELGDDRVVCDVWDSEIYGQDMGVVVGTPGKLRQLADVGLPIQTDPADVMESG
jgi:hypothetical protein